MEHCNVDVSANRFDPAFLIFGLAVGTFGLVALHYTFPKTLIISKWNLFHTSKSSRKKIRVFLDGCFDMMHYGHANALRQAKALGDQLVVGVVSDEEIIANKGPPVMKDVERLAMVSSVKWVDEVIPNTPYSLTESFLEELFSVHKIDFVIHGDDPCILPDGSDAYAVAKRLGKFKQIKRTEGVSSTDLVGRLLTCLKNDLESEERSKVSHFLPTSRRIVQFSSGKVPPLNGKIVYIDGDFDLFHVGHVEVLRKARELGDFLLVGIHSDESVRNLRGPQWPIMDVHERSLSVMACRYVDEVVFGAPHVITRDLITTFNVSIVVGNSLENSDCESDRFSEAKTMGKYEDLQLLQPLETLNILDRIMANHDAFQKRNKLKRMKELDYYSSKEHLADL